jgi:hypothetical protein
MCQTAATPAPGRAILRAGFCPISPMAGPLARTPRPPRRSGSPIRPPRRPTARRSPSRRPPRRVRGSGRLAPRRSRRQRPGCESGQIREGTTRRFQPTRFGGHGATFSVVMARRSPESSVSDRAGSALASPSSSSVAPRSAARRPALVPVGRRHLRGPTVLGVGLHHVRHAEQQAVRVRTQPVAYESRARPAGRAPRLRNTGSISGRSPVHTGSISPKASSRSTAIS